MFLIGGRAALALHVLFSLLNTMYIPYAVVYFVDRVHLMCSVNSACIHVTIADYLTEEIIVMLVGIILHIPFWFFVLLILDVKKSGGRASDVIKTLLVCSSYVFILLHWKYYFKNSGNKYNLHFQCCLKLQHREKKSFEETVENNDVGEHEDDDVKTERQKVVDILASDTTKPPVVVVQVFIILVT